MTAIFDFTSRVVKLSLLVAGMNHAKPWPVQVYGSPRKMTTASERNLGAHPTRIFSPMLLRDEAIDNLHTQKEAALPRKVSNVRRWVTGLIIARRLAMVWEADRIAAVDAGRVAMQGTHAKPRQDGDLHREFARSLLAH